MGQAPSGGCAAMCRGVPGARASRRSAGTPPGRARALKRCCASCEGRKMLPSSKKKRKISHNKPPASQPYTTAALAIPNLPHVGRGAQEHKARAERERCVCWRVGAARTHGRTTIDDDSQTRDAPRPRDVGVRSPRNVATRRDASDRARRRQGRVRGVRPHTL